MDKIGYIFDIIISGGIQILRKCFKGRIYIEQIILKLLQ